MPTTTAPEIRDRMIAVIAALVPTHHAGERFRQFNNERDAKFIPWAEGHVGAVFRMFQVRDNGSRKMPAVSNTDVEEHEVTIEIIVAFPQDARTGNGQALDRDVVYDADLNAIDEATGMCGHFNFQSPNPAAWWRSSAEPERVEGDGVDFLVLRHTLAFYRLR